jgi:uncharacterized protein
MSFSLFPKAPKFFKLFREQNRIIVEAATVLNTLVNDFSELDTCCQRVNRLESEGDVINRTIADSLATTFITPIDREDIHDLNVSQEAILNLIQAVSARIAVSGFERIRFPAKRKVSNLKAMVTEIGTMLVMLGRKEDISKNIKQVKQLKNECEMLLLTGLTELYDDSNPSPAAILDILKWTHVYDRIDKAILRTWGLAKIIQGIGLKNA